jgi:hypothetical protein
VRREGTAGKATVTGLSSKPAPAKHRTPIALPNETTGRAYPDYSQKKSIVEPQQRNRGYLSLSVKKKAKSYIAVQKSRST